MTRCLGVKLLFFCFFSGELEREGKVKPAALGGTTKTILTLMPSKQAADSVFGTKMTRQEMKRRISKKRRSMSQVYPEGVQDVKQFTEQGMDAYNLDDVEEQQHALDTIRKLPCKLSVKKEFR